jgi:hypothetical protein
VPVDLETIILKAVSKHPADRYATAEEFAADLQRFLEDKPIQAKRPSLADRARKWRRRHPSFVAAAVVLLVLLTAGSLASAYVIRGEQEKAIKRADEADARFELARRSVNEMIEISEEELADNPFAERPRKRLLEAALNYYQEFIELRRDDPKAQEELIATQDRVRKILADLALLQGAGELDWLKQPSVLDDLGLHDEQRTQVGDLSRRLDNQRGESFRKFRDKSQAEKRQSFLDLARANDEDARKILGSDRMKRLSQIARQLQGLAAFRDPDVASALRLTTDQRERIRTIEAESFRGPPPPDERRPPEDKRPGGPPEDFRRMQEQKLKASFDKVLKLLTPDQLKAWNDLRGEPFTGTISIPRHFGPPGPR